MYYIYFNLMVNIFILLFLLDYLQINTKILKFSALLKKKINNEKLIINSIL